MSDPVADLIATAQPRTETVPVCARGDLVDRHAALLAELADAVERANESSLAGGSDPDVERIHAEIEAVQDEQAASTTTFTLESIGALAWSNLLRAHTPRKGVDHGLAFNLATFPPAAVAACVTDPPMSVEQATALYGSDTEPGVLHSAEWDRLFSAAYTLNERTTPHPKLPAAIESLLRSGRSSTSAANEESLAPSSSVDSGAL